MSKDGVVRDFEQQELNVGDIVVFSANGYLSRGRILQTRMDNIYGAMLVQSLRDKTRVCAASADCCVLMERPSPLQATDKEADRGSGRTDRVRARFESTVTTSEPVADVHDSHACNRPTSA